MGKFNRVRAGPKKAHEVRGGIQEQLTSAFSHLLDVEQRVEDEFGKDVPGYLPGLQRRPNTRPETGYKVNSVEPKGSARLSKGGTGVNCFIKELDMQVSEVKDGTTSGTMPEAALTSTASQIAEGATTKIAAAEEGLAKGIALGRLEAQRELQQQAHQLEEKVEGFWGRIKGHFIQNKGKYGVALGALGVIGGEAAYAAYRGKRGDQLTYNRTGDTGGMYVAGDQPQMQPPAGTEGTDTTTTRGRGR